MPEPKLHLAFLGLGSNIGDKKGNLLEALCILDNMPGIRITEVSSIYESEPWGVLEQPPFLNLVAVASTTREPYELLEACMEVEKELGRVRREKWGPRAIDVDILLLDDLEIMEEDLVIPHPRMLEREFVMVPLLELRPDITVPGMSEISLRYPVGSEGKVTKTLRFGKEEWHG